MVYEPHDAPKVTWNAAFIAIDSPLARISSIEQLWDVQPELSLDSAYWTALKLNSNGSFQWGRVPYISAHLPLPCEITIFHLIVGRLNWFVVLQRQSNKRSQIF